MTSLFNDSFDPYTSTNDAALGRWIGFSNMSIVGAVSTAFGGGQGVSFYQGSGQIIAVWETATNETTVYFSIRLKEATGSVSAGEYTHLTFRDGTTDQVTIRWNNDGSVDVRNGSNNGTVLMSVAGVFSLQTWDSYQGQIVIGATGSVILRKNGAATPFLSLTNANTKTTANSYVNSFRMGATYSSGGQIDDIWFNNDDGIAPTGWPGDYRILWSPAANVIQSQLSPNPSNIFVQYTSDSSYVSTVTILNTMKLVNVTANATGILASLYANIGTGGTGHIKMALYDATGTNGGPGTLLATSAEITNPTPGATTIAVSGGPTITSGTIYWVAIISDFAALTIVGAGNRSVATLARTYTSGFPSSAGGFTTGNINGLTSMGMNITPTNAFLVSDATQDGDATTVFSSTPNAKDIYSIGGLGSINPAAIIGVRPVVMWKKSDSGGRSGTVGIVAHGSSDIAQISNITPSLSYTYASKFMPLDPIGSTWSTSNVNSLTISLMVAS